MQDRFKFRIWDKHLKKMFDCIQINFTENAYGSNKIKDNECSIHLMYQPHLELMQCTGLKDKNGKHIYEGDILKNTKTNECLTVAWHNTKAGYVWSKTVSNTYLSEFGALFRVFDKYEIIGNIYENSELLERNNDKTTR